jgi:pyruvate dehydrogenase phosphatase
MDSYAANSKNEDRSQYIFDIITTQSNETDPASMDPTDEKEIFFCACYDGHGGEEAVEFVQSRLYSNIKKHLVLKGPQSVRDAIFSGFTETDQQFNQQSLKKFEQGVWSACSVGACAVIALVVDKRLYIASCGDCRAIMAFRDSEGKVTVEQVTFDHSANEAKEQARLRGMHPDDYDVIREIGYKNFYVKGRLQPTRSIGDTYMKCKEVNRAPMPRGLRINGSFKKPYITAVPDIFEFDLDDRLPEFLVLGSDGLFGELSNEEVAEKVAFFRKQGVENVSQALRTEVLTRVAECYGFDRAEIESILPGERRNYHDDITIDIVHFAPPVA